MAKQPSVINYISPFVLIAIGVWHYARHGWGLLTVIPVGLGVFALYLVLFNHPLLQRILTFLEKLWYPIGQSIGLLLFALAFYIIFAPVGLLLRLLKKDILNKNFKNNAPSYWIARPKEEHHYTQQF